MSKSITIQEGGIGKQFTADKLKTNLVGGGSCLWVPEDETRLGTKHITKNGTYLAQSDGYYGYSEVTVNGIGTATGTDSDGDEAVAYSDPQTGELVTDKAPSSIKVVTPPTNPYGIYVNGQTISTEGMVVKAYLKTGNEYGIVPNSEITIQPTTAIYDASTDVPGGYSTDGGEIAEQFPSYAQNVNFPIASSGSVSIESDMWDNDYSGGYIFNTDVTQSGYTLWACSKTPTTVRFGYRPHYAPGQEAEWTYSDINVNKGVTFNGETFYVNVIGTGSGLHNMNYHGPSKVTGDTTFIAYCILFGNTTGTRAGSHQTINVSWPRPGDGKVLETTFEILVAPGYTPNGGE